MFYFYCSSLLVWNSLFEKKIDCEFKRWLRDKGNKKYYLIYRCGAQLWKHSLKDVLLCEEDWKSGVRWGSAPDK